MKLMAEQRLAININSYFYFFNFHFCKRIRGKI